MKHISILGSTGSIGTQALEVIRAYPEEFCVDALSASTKVHQIFSQIQEFKPKLVCMYEEAKAKELLQLVMDFGKEEMVNNLEIVHGMEGLKQVAEYNETDILITSVVGMIGLLPTLEGIRKGKRIALANKETLVTAGELVMSEAKRWGAEIRPVDSEHSAIFQCLMGESRESIEKLIITASGGPFRGMKRSEIQQMTAKEALKHPNWSMGAKITIDSATLMNKGLEVIEAKWLFDMSPDKIQVLVHPQSIIHSMIETVDGSVKAQLGVPSMKLPILFALTYPKRMEFNDEKLNLEKVATLTFERPDTDSFPCLKLAYQALKQGGSCLSVLNGANEVLVHEYLKGRIGFYDISTIIEESLNKHENIGNPSLDEVLEGDRWAREFALKKIDAKL